MENPNRVILSTTHVDQSGDQMTVEALQKMADLINGEMKLKYTIDHNRTFPPKGFLTNAIVVERNGYHYLEGERIAYNEGEVVSWNKDFTIERFNFPVKFYDIERQVVHDIEISIDPDNFESLERYNSFVNEIENIKEPHIELRQHYRKSSLKDVEIVITLSSFLIPILKKIGERIADKYIDQAIDIGEQKIKEFYQVFKKVIKAGLDYTEKNGRTPLIILSIPGKPHVELIAKTTSQTIILNALRGKKMEKVELEIENLSKIIEIDKIQYILSETGKWKLNFIITKKGEAISRKIATDKRDKRLKIIEEQLAKRGIKSAMSVGMSARKYGKGRTLFK